MGLPAWTEVRVLAPLEWCELVAEALCEHAPSGVAYGRPSLASPEPPHGHEWLRAFAAEQQDTPAWREAVEGALRDLPRRAGVPELAHLRPSFQRLPPEDFAQSWRREARAFRLGRLCVVPPGWRGALRAGDVRLELEPGGAFGTGRHPSTRACLLALQRRLRPGQRVLDVGSGSGILAVAAVLLGAREALGVDDDPHALPYARELARANGVERRCSFEQASVADLDARRAPADGLLANLYADLIQAHARPLARSLAPGGWFGFAGCVAAKRAATLAALGETDLQVEERATRGRWDAYAGVRAGDVAAR